LPAAYFQTFSCFFVVVKHFLSQTVRTVQHLPVQPWKMGGLANAEHVATLVSLVPYQVAQPEISKTKAGLT